MTIEIQRKIAKTIAMIVIVTGLAVIGGWIFDINFLTSLSPAWVSMKFDTAVAFVLSGAALFCIAQVREGGAVDAAQVILPVTSLIILLLMGTLFFSAIFRIPTGVEGLFVHETNPTMTVMPGRPSVPTMLNFILIAIAAILTTLNPGKLPLLLKITGFIVAAIGALAVTGYLVNMPVLYYFVAGANSAMACHTAILFVLLGMGFLCL